MGNSEEGGNKQGIQREYPDEMVLERILITREISEKRFYDLLPGNRLSGDDSSLFTQD